MPNRHPAATDTVSKAWTPTPDWVLALAKEVDEAQSRRKVGAKIGYSTTTVSQVINNRYPGNIEKLEAKVRGALMGDCVDCPVVGPITTDRCRDYQEEPFAVTSSLRRRMYRACRNGCPHSSLEVSDVE